MTRRKATKYRAHNEENNTAWEYMQETNPNNFPQSDSTRNDAICHISEVRVLTLFRLARQEGCHRIQ